MARQAVCGGGIETQSVAVRAQKFLTVFELYWNSAIPWSHGSHKHIQSFNDAFISLDRAAMSPKVARQP